MSHKTFDLPQITLLQNASYSYRYQFVDADGNSVVPDGSVITAFLKPTDPTPTTLTFTLGTDSEIVQEPDPSKLIKISVPMDISGTWKWVLYGNWLNGDAITVQRVIVVEAAYVDVVP